MGMNTYIKRRWILSFFMILALLWTGNLMGAESPSREVLLPGDFTVEKEFKPGLGIPIGQVARIRGEAVIIHTGDIKGYMAGKDLPLYKEDRIVTRDNGYIRLELKDQSMISLTPNTSLELNESVYEPKKKNRFSFFKMALGKARFIVTNVYQFRRSEFKIKTSTAIIGVRGSDFIIMVEPDRSEVTALDETILDVISLADPSAPPIILEAFENTIIEEGRMATEPEEVTPDQVEVMKQEFKVLFEPVEGEETVTEPSAVRPKKETPIPRDEAVPEAEVRRETRILETPEIMAGPEELVPEGGVLISEDELVDPRAIIRPEESEEFIEPVIIDEIERTTELEDVQREREEIEEILSEEEVIRELPRFQQTPE
jgi:hypothetical protein